VNGVRCRRCPASLIFIKMRSGKAMPVDPWPDTLGNVAATMDTFGRWIDGHVTPPRDGRIIEPGYQIFMPHFNTCAEPKGRKRRQPDEQDALSSFDETP
jgi:hypothetical protein